MGYRPRIKVRVAVPALDESQPPVFVFGAADEAFLRIVAVQRFLREQGIDVTALAAGDLPVELTLPLCQMVRDGIRSWESVSNEDGKPLDCTPENVHELPTMDKLKIAIAVLAEVVDVEGNAPKSSEPPTP